MLSQEAIRFRRLIEDSTRFPDTCDGGDYGSPQLRTIWLLGIEPGWSVEDKANRTDEIFKREPFNVEDELRAAGSNRFALNAFKLLAAMGGTEPTEYKRFARQKRPFENDSGYFKGNLYPFPASNLKEWDSEAIRLTGFMNKADYINWVKGRRFQIIEEWIEKCRPSLFIGVGVSSLQDFMRVTRTDKVETCTFLVNGKNKKIHWSLNGAVPLVVVPHLSGGTNGLNSYEAIQEAANIIRRKTLCK